MVDGFTLPADRLLVIDDPAHTSGLDVTYRVKNFGKKTTASDFIKTGPDWTGSIKLIDTSTGKTVTLPQGRAT